MQKMIKLPVGTKFWVNNGHWDGQIIEKENKKYIEAYEGKVLKNVFSIDEDYELDIIIK